jgi:hypothetical protein
LMHAGANDHTGSAGSLSLVQSPRSPRPGTAGTPDYFGATARGDVPDAD